MQKFSTFTSIAAPLPLNSVDTDQILPSQFLKRITKSGFEDALFFNWRQNPDFVLNRQEHTGAQILVAGTDFGAGSSREHAVWALRDYGFKVVIAPKFADIFRGNAGKQGLLAAQMDEADVSRIWAAIAADPGTRFTVSLEDCTVIGGDLRVSFQVDDSTRWRLLAGLDDISITLQNEQAISDFEASRPAWMPTTLPVR